MYNLIRKLFANTLANNWLLCLNQDGNSGCYNACHKTVKIVFSHESRMNHAAVVNADGACSYGHLLSSKLRSWSPVMERHNKISPCVSLAGAANSRVSWERLRNYVLDEPLIRRRPYGWNYFNSELIAVETTEYLISIKSVKRIMSRMVLKDRKILSSAKKNIIIN